MSQSVHKSTSICHPNVIIAGVPKCGTTSLFDWLAAHPDVCASSVKETRFFIDADYPLKKTGANFIEDGLASYSDFFVPCRAAQAEIILEATPDYLYQETALRQLPLLDPVPTIIVLLRKPSARIFSLFNYAKNNIALLDRKMPFAQFIARLMEQTAPFANEILDHALEHSRYVNYLEKWAAALPAGKLHVFLFEQMLQEPNKFLGDIAELLNIDADFYNDFDAAGQNESFQVKSQVIHRFARKFGRELSHRAPLFRKLKSLYLTVNTTGGAIPPEPDDLRILSELDDAFAADNARLAAAFDLDLAHWT